MRAGVSSPAPIAHHGLPQRSRSVPSLVHASPVLFEHRAPMPAQSLPSVGKRLAALEARVAASPDPVTHPWRAMLEAMGRWRATPRTACVECPPSVVEAEITVRASDRLVSWSVLLVELVVTSVFLSFGIVSAWFGAWTLVGLGMREIYGSSLEGRWEAVLTELAIGLAALVLSVLASRTSFVADRIYRPWKPFTWGELVLRTVADRLIQVTQMWGSVCIWAAIWDLWTYFILPEEPWYAALTAYFVGLFILLCTFSLRSAVTPPMVFVEDTILAEQLGSRWNMLSGFLERLRKRRAQSPLEQEWEGKGAFPIPHPQPLVEPAAGPM